ncbi:MAG: M15 family metallopeptidase [Marmoricola sp.]
MFTEPALTSHHRATRWAILCAVIAAVVAFFLLSHTPSLSAKVLSAATTKAPAPTTATTRSHHALLPQPAPNGESLNRAATNGPDAADGVLPGPISVFSNAYVGITNLNPQLLAALRRAATEANRYGIEIDVDSGWRSRAYQEQLFDQAIAKYGSAEAAARWVARPGTSVHEAGDAVDVVGGGAAAWLSRNGAGYGLCRMYGNEPWHFEWRPEAVSQGCPTMYADPTDDPRLGK